MSAQKHTPGPWRIAGKGTIRAGNGWVASVNWRNREANASLIAAAPDLLAVARLVLDANDGIADYNLMPTEMAARDAAVAAIAKAEGRS